MERLEEDIVAVAGEYFKRGTQIICVPRHLRHVVEAYSDDPEEMLKHDGIEFGFVDKLHSDGKAVWCRYWSKYDRGELRTKANSEATPIEMLRWRDTYPQSVVDSAIKRYLYGM
jgi:hypothetical protein